MGSLLIESLGTVADIKTLKNSLLKSEDESFFERFRKNEPTIVVDDIGQFLEDKIVFGEIPPGSHLPEESISQRYNVHRHLVREALRSLEHEGLAVWESRRGVWVTQMSLDGLDDVYTCRRSLEALAAELAAQRRTKEDLEGIVHALNELESAVATLNPRNFFRLNLALSAKVHAAAHNKTLLRLIIAIGKQSYRYRFLAYLQRPEMMEASVQGHKAVVDAIRSGDSRKAKKMIEDMVDASWVFLRTILS